MKKMFLPLLLLPLLCVDCGHGASPEDPVPPGTFCFTLAHQAETCVPASGVAVHKTVTAGNVWFKLDTMVSMPWHDDFGNPEMDSFPMTLSGQVPAQVPLPRAADLAQLSVPLAGTCRHYRATTPFGGCGEESIAAICQATEQTVDIQVVSLTDQEVELEIDGAVDVHLPDSCCNNSTATCNPAPPAPQFMPAGPYPITARVHAHF